MKKIISRLTMKRLSYNFTDSVTGKKIFDYVDIYGDIYMATYPFLPWSFRIKN